MILVHDDCVGWQWCMNTTNKYMIHDRIGYQLCVFTAEGILTHLMQGFLAFAEKKPLYKIERPSNAEPPRKQTCYVVSDNLLSWMSSKITDFFDLSLLLDIGKGVSAQLEWQNFTHTAILISLSNNLNYGALFFPIIPSYPLQKTSIFTSEVCLHKYV